MSLQVVKAYLGREILLMLRDKKGLRGVLVQESHLFEASQRREETATIVNNPIIGLGIVPS